MTGAIEGVAQGGVISTQIEHVQNDRPAVSVTPPPEPPPPPPPESGRGATLDTSA